MGAEDQSGHKYYYVYNKGLRVSEVEFTILEGKIVKKVLQVLGIDEKALLEELHKQNFTLADIFHGELDTCGDCRVCRVFRLPLEAILYYIPVVKKISTALNKTLGYLHIDMHYDAFGEIPTFGRYSNGSPVSGIIYHGRRSA